ncbi:MAPEG family protein [Roseovarius salinarum]|uniref:MAPEG family protein n=1 Tax=Roseovarius salinarum TaxID=1981892 RepID=UPI000C31C04A|nr:MAPEG family protein [Roseovarius salinarum]
MGEQAKIAIGTAGGLVWAVALLVGAAAFVDLPVFTLMPTIMTAFLAPGLVMAAMIGRAAARRFFDPSLIEGAMPLPGSAAATDQRVLANTVEQLMLALCVWPAAAVILGANGPGAIMTLGVGFALARLVFWWGCHASGPVRAFGFAATFLPTVLVAVWALWALVSGSGS